MQAPTGSVSDPGLLRAARSLRLSARLLEAGLYLVIASSVAAFGAVHTWTYAPFWIATLVLLAVAVGQVLTALELRRRLGPRRFAFHPTGLWLVLDEDKPYGMDAWAYDLGAPFPPRPPLLVPGVAFLALILLQLVPLPAALVLRLNGSQDEGLRALGGWWPLTLSVPETVRGLVFVASLLALHFAAAIVFVRREARERLARFLSILGLSLAVVALAHRATGSRLVYWFFAPIESDGSNSIFGPFVNRNHFAGYMLLVVPITLGLLADTLRRYLRRTGPRANLRRLLVALQSPEGVAFLYALVPSLAAVAAFLAANSRGALVAFVGALVSSAFAVTRFRRILWATPLLFLVLAAAWFGPERLASRFRSSVKESAGRTVVWRDALGRMGGLWPLGSGFNTFGSAISRATVWTLPKGATPWREPYETSVTSAPRLGFRAYLESPALGWYREAHNDYVQVLVETGLSGFVVAVAALIAALKAARRDGWLFLAVGGVALHCLVEFDLQIPAIAALFVCVVALAGSGRAPRPATP